MKKLVLSFVFLFSLIALLGFTENLVEVKAEETGFTLTYHITFDGSTTTGDPLTVNDLSYGQLVNFDLSTHTIEGNEFLGYLVEGKVSPSLNPSSSFRVTENTSIKAFFKDAGQVAVIFMDANQDFVEVRYTDIDSKLNTLPAFNTFIKPGLNPTGWQDENRIAITTDTVFTEDTIVSVVYESAVEESYNLQVINGVASDGPYMFNDYVTVTATGSGGMSFDYWKKDGAIASYDQVYTFTVVSNHKLEAVYSWDTIQKPAETQIYVSKVFGDLRSGYLTVLGQFDLFEGDSVVEYGIISSTLDNFDLSSNEEDVNITNVNKYNPETNEFVISFPEPLDTLPNYRAFITIINNNGVQTYYSNVWSHVKVFYYNSDNWDDVYSYTFGTFDDTMGTWPGTKMIKENSTDWWYTYISVIDTDLVSAGMQYDFTIVFNNGETGSNERKTQDIFIDDTTGLYVTASGGISETKSVVSVTTRVFFANTKSWDLYVHVFGNTASDTTTFPGTNNASILIEEKDSLNNSTGWYYIDIETNKSTFGLVYNNNTNPQTKDIILYPGETIYLTIGNLDIGDGKYNVDIQEDKDSITSKIYFRKNDDWNTSIHYNVYGGTLSDNDWPGVLAYADSAPNWYYSYIIGSTTLFSVIVHDYHGMSTPGGYYPLRFNPGTHYIYYDYNENQWKTTGPAGPHGYPN